MSRSANQKLELRGTGTKIDARRASSDCARRILICISVLSGNDASLIVLEQLYRLGLNMHLTRRTIPCCAASTRRPVSKDPAMNTLETRYQYPDASSRSR